ncbi:MAG: hypothetical protein DRG78_04685 [Epsilonproteobacteria bacterium]|nr:MAG: hypothetical protein DRG78_04685 [Campylobacterota bacterium]
MSKLSKKIEIEVTGNYLVAELTGVDLTASGEFEGKKYGASVKLKFVQNEKIIKNVNGIDVPTLKAVSQIIKISCNDIDLPKLIQKYNEKLGQVIMLKYTANDNSSFSCEESDIKFI